MNITLNHTQAIAVVGYGCFTLDGETYGFEAEWDNDYPGTIGIRYQDTEEKELYVWDVFGSADDPRVEVFEKDVIRLMKESQVEIMEEVKK